MSQLRLIAALLVLPGVECQPSLCEDTVGKFVLGSLGMCPDAKVEPSKLRVFVVGHSRTGTSSLRAALDSLGFKTYHMADLTSYQGHPSAMAQAALTGNASGYFAALERDGFNATAENGVFWREAYRLYPDAKFILQVRPEAPDTEARLQRSWALAIQFLDHFWWGPPGYGLRALGGQDLLTAICACNSFHCGDGMPGALAECVGDAPLSHNWPDPARCVKKYRAHNDEVRATIPKQQLLEFNWKRGFQPLCHFLDVPDASCPKSDYPHVNDAAAMGTAANFFWALRYGWFLMLVTTASCFHQCLRPRVGVSKKTV